MHIVHCLYATEWARLFGVQLLHAIVWCSVVVSYMHVLVLLYGITYSMVCYGAKCAVVCVTPTRPPPERTCQGDPPGCIVGRPFHVTKRLFSVTYVTSIIQGQHLCRCYSQVDLYLFVNVIGYH